MGIILREKKNNNILEINILRNFSQILVVVVRGGF